MLCLNSHRQLLPTIFGMYKYIYIYSISVWIWTVRVDVLVSKSVGKCQSSTERIMKGGEVSGLTWTTTHLQQCHFFSLWLFSWLLLFIFQTCYTSSAYCHWLAHIYIKTNTPTVQNKNKNKINTIWKITTNSVSSSKNLGLVAPRSLSTGIFIDTRTILLFWLFLTFCPDPPPWGRVALSRRWRPFGQYSLSFFTLFFSFLFNTSFLLSVFCV